MQDPPLELDPVTDSDQDDVAKEIGCLWMTWAVISVLLADSPPPALMK